METYKCKVGINYNMDIYFKLKSLPKKFTIYLTLMGYDHNLVDAQTIIYNSLPKTCPFSYLNITINRFL